MAKRKSTGWTVQRSSGYWYVVLRYVDPATGEIPKNPKWLSTGLPAKGNKRAAQAMAPELVAKFLEDLESGAAAIRRKAGGAMTIGEIGKDWLEAQRKLVEKDRLRLSTLEGYKSHLRLHILPALGRLTPEELTPEILQGFFDELEKTGSAKGGPLSPKSLKEYRSVLRMVLKHGYYSDFCGKIEALDRVILPKVEKPPHTVYDKDQLEQIIKETQNSTFGDLVLITSLYGIRRSELFGLRWGQIDTRAGIVKIDHTVVRVKSTVAKDDTKSKASKRDFPLLPPIKVMLDRRREEAIEAGLPVGPDDYIFTWTSGRHKGQRVGLDYFASTLKTHLQRHGHPPITPHELRHSVASILISDGYQAADVQAWLGHADIQTTIDTYGHLFDRRKEKIGETMAGIVSS